jgi:hypothetical protein
VLLSDLAMRGDGALPGAQLLGDLEAYLVLGVPLHLIWRKSPGSLVHHLHIGLNCIAYGDKN